MAQSLLVGLVPVLVLAFADLVPCDSAACSAHKRANPRVTYGGTYERSAARPDAGSDPGVRATRKREK